jgi:hypothetical protein
MHTFNSTQKPLDLDKVDMDLDHIQASITVPRMTPQWKNLHDVDDASNFSRALRKRFSLLETMVCKEDDDYSVITVKCRGGEYLSTKELARKVANFYNNWPTNPA